SALKSPTHTYQSGGTFKVVFIASNSGCSDTANKDLFITVGINDPVLEQSIKVYPIPAQDHLNISVEGLVIKNLKLFNILGQSVMELNNFSDNKLDVSSLQKGSYILNLETNKGLYKKVINITN